MMENERRRYFKRRAFWWLDAWIIGTIVILLLSGLPMVLWLSTYNSDLAVTMFSVTYLSLLVFVIGYIKRSLLEPTVVADEKKTEEAKRELEEHRIKARREYIQTELDFLGRGERGPVLDIWRLNEGLRKRHPFFSQLETVIIDPGRKELWIRVMVGKLYRSEMDRDLRIGQLLRNIASFVVVLARDEYLKLFHPYFDTVVIEVYSLREREGALDEPFAMYSGLLTRREVEHGALLEPSWQTFTKLGEHRFADGAAVAPHRGIEGSNVSGLM